MCGCRALVEHEVEVEGEHRDVCCAFEFRGLLRSSFASVMREEEMLYRWIGICDAIGFRHGETLEKILTDSECVLLLLQIIV